MSDTCPVCGTPYTARVWDDTPRQLPVPGADEVCISGGENVGDFEVFVHA